MRRASSADPVARSPRPASTTSSSSESSRLAAPSHVEELRLPVVGRALARKLLTQPCSEDWAHLFLQAPIDGVEVRRVAGHQLHAVLEGDQLSLPARAAELLIQQVGSRILGGSAARDPRRQLDLPLGGSVSVAITSKSLADLQGSAGWRRRGQQEGRSLRLLHALGLPGFRGGLACHRLYYFTSARLRDLLACPASQRNALGLPAGRTACRTFASAHIAPG